MKSFFYKSFLLFILVAASIASINLYAYHSIDNASFKVDKKIHILVLGDSHTECAIDDARLKNSINMSQSADTYMYSYLKLKKFLSANPQIDTVLLSYNFHSMSEEMNEWITGMEYLSLKMPLYLPFVTREEFETCIAPNFLHFTQNAMIRYNGLLRSCGLDIETFRELKLGGYLFLDRDKLKEDIHRRAATRKLQGKVSHLQAKYLDKIVKLCANHNVRLVLVNSPVYHASEFYDTDGYNKYYRDNYSNVPLWDYSNLALAADCYGDISHLNFRGARGFSEILNQRF